MATTTKVIVQIHERTTYAQLTTDLQLRELGYESTNDSFNFNNNAGTNFTVWAKESTGVAYDNAVTLSSTVAIVGVLTATATSVFNGGLASNGDVTVTSGDLTVNGHTDIGKNVSMSLVSSGAINLRLGMLAGTPSNASDGFVGVHNTGGPGQTAGDLILIPRTSVGAGIRFFTGLTTPVERLSIDSNGDLEIISGDLDITAGNVVVASGTVQITKSNIASYNPTANNVITTMRNSQSSVDDAVVGLSLSTARTSGSNGVVNLLCVPSGSGSGDFIVQTRNGGTYQESLRVIASGKVGIGTSSPDGTLHIHTATAGSITANANADDLVIENSTHGGISILGPDASEQNIYFGSPSDAVGAIARWVHSDNIFRVGTANTGASTILTSGAFVDAVTIESTGDVEIISGDLDITAGNLTLTAGDATLTNGGILLSTTDKKVRVSDGGTIFGEFYCDGTNTILNCTTNDLRLHSSDALRATISAIGLTMAPSHTLITAATVSGKSGFRLPHGTAPSAPNDGDMWTTTAGLYVRINSGTLGVAVSGSFTATLTGVSGSVTGTAYWSKTGNSVVLQLPFINGTSDDTPCTITGMPTDIRPTRTQSVYFPLAVFDSGSLTDLRFAIYSTGVVELLQYNSGWTVTFTGSGTKGLGSSLSFAYQIG